MSETALGEPVIRKDKRSFRFGPRDVSPADPLESEAVFKPELIAAGLCGLFGIAGAVTSGTAASLPCYAAAYFAGSYFAAREMWNLLRQGILDVHFLMLLVAAGSASIGGWGEGATLLFLFSFSGALEKYAMGRTQREIRSLFKTSPKTAQVLDENGVERTAPVEDLRPGWRLLLKPGDLVPTDSEVTRGRSACDESNLTGEATPVEKAPGDTLLAGTVNLWGAVEAKVIRPASQSALQRIIEIIREAQHQKAPAQLFADRFSSRYTYGVLLVTITMFFIWWLAMGIQPFENTEGQRSAFYRAMTLLVVSSPCALVLSIPSAILSAIAFGARRGILFRGGGAVERLAGTTVVVMDKTGTVTTGDLRVEKIESFPEGSERELASLAYSLESLSTHPLARAITAFGKKNGLTMTTLDDFESVPGFGLRARAGTQTIQLGKRAWVASGREVPNLPAGETHPGLSEVWIASDGKLGRILLRDDIREQAREVITELKAANLKTMLLTGDRAEAGELAGKFLGIDEVRSGLRPEDKLRVITSLKRRGEHVAMIGDGVNDAPSLAAADVGVAMGARGADAALEQADVVLMNDRFERFLTALRISKRARRVIQQNLFISLGTVTVLAALAIAGKIPLSLGVIGHEGSTVVVVMNSLRLLFHRKEVNPSGRIPESA